MSCYFQIFYVNFTKYSILYVLQTAVPVPLLVTKDASLSSTAKVVTIAAAKLMDPHAQ